MNTSNYRAYPVGTVVEFSRNYKNEKYTLAGTVIGFVERNQLAVLPPDIPNNQIHFSEKNSKTDRVLIEVRRYSEKRKDFTGAHDYYAISPARVTPVSPNTPRFFEDNLDIKASDLKEEGDE